MNPPALALTAVFSCALVGQAVDPDRRDDLRDVVTVARGKPVTGRVANPFHPDELLVLQGGKRVRVARKDVTALDTVTMRLRELLQMHAVVPDEPDRLWILAEWAASRQLHAMAQVFAYRILCIDPEHAESHQLLGHRRRGSEWLWRRGDRFMPRAAFDAYVADIGHPFELRSEHWWIKTDAGVRRAVDALLDLERLYLFFFDRFGNDLDAYEVLRPVPVLVWRNADAMPSWTELRIPYYSPPGTDEGIYSFFAGAAERPASLFRTGTEALLNRCVAIDFTAPSPEHRLVDWFEIGFGQWVESQLDGPPGRAAPRAPSFAPERARLLLGSNRYPLPNLLGRNVDDDYYDSVTSTKDLDWAYAEGFVGFLMSDEGTRSRAMRYVYVAMREKKGDSSSAFDKAFGRSIESMDKPFVAWLRTQAQLPDGKR